VILFVIGLFAQDYHGSSHTPEEYLTGASHPLYLVGISLILGTVILFIPEFYPIVKGKIKI